MKQTLSIFLVTLCLVLAACDSNGDGSDCEKIKIGAGLPLSGGSEGTGLNVLRAIRLAADDVNSTGGIRDMTVEVEVADDGSGSDQSVVQSAATMLATDECVVAVVGHLNSNATIWAQEIYDAAGVVNFTPASTASSIAENSSWTFRDITHNGYKGRFLADYAQNQLGISRVGIIYDGDSFGSDLEAFFSAEAEEIGLEIVGEYSYSRSSPSESLAVELPADVGELLAAGAESIYAAGILNEGVIIVNAVRNQAGSEMPIIWSGWEEPLLIEEAGTNAEGVHVPIHRVYDPANPDVSDFKSRFADGFGEPPGAFAPFAYDATRMLLEAVDQAGTDRDAVRAYLAGIDSQAEAYPGLTGAIYFNQEGDLAEHFISALVVREGQFVPYE